MDQIANMDQEDMEEDIDNMVLVMEVMVNKDQEK
jgi:hypothetical protein